MMKRTRLVSWLIYLSILASCQLNISYTPISGVSPQVPQSLLLGHDVGSFWTIPAKGNPRVLVVPVEFNGQPFANPSQVVSQLEVAFNGEDHPMIESGYSLNEYYRISSFGEIDITGVVTQPFRTRFQASYYENLTSQDPNTVIIDEMMAAWNSQIDFSEFDSNDDGYLDGLYLIYNHPAEGWDSFWWAYLYQYFGNRIYDGVQVASYVWIPYEFVYADQQLDVSTIIHETGHKLGLEDYYDYAPNDGSGNEWGLGGADMMDGTVGDHNPFSKLLLDWIEPRVVEEGMDVTLRPFSESGDALIITDAWNDTLFDEYLIAMYYTPTGLFEGYDDYYFDGQSGLVLYHVDARLGPNNSPNYPTYFRNNNTDSIHKLIRFIEADGNNSLYLRNPKGWMWASDVYRPGHIFGDNRNLGYTWNQTSRGTIPFTIRVNEESANQTSLSLSIRF